MRRTAFLLALLTLLLSGSVVHAQGGIVWNLTGGPAGGLVNAMALVPNAPGMLYVGTNGGVYLTRDDGAHWQAASKGLADDPTITALAVARDPNIVFAGTHAGIYRTGDAGANWTLTDPRFADQLILSLLVDALTPNTIYAGTTNTVLRSDDAGNTWRDVGADLKSARVWSLALTVDAATLYAATDGGIYASRDHGTHWLASSDGLPEGAHPQSIVITSQGLFTSTNLGLFRSKDGKTWAGMGSAFGAILPRPLSADARQPERILAVLPQGIVKSADGGATWALLPNPAGTAPVLSFALGDKTIYMGTGRGVLKSTDEAGTWQSANAGLIGTGVQAMLLLPGNPGTILAATRYALARTQDHGVTWSEARGLADPYVASLAHPAQDPNEIYAGTWGSALFVSKDGGVSFTRLVENLANDAPISSLAILRANDQSTIIYAGTFGNGLFKSGDGGKNWTAQSQELGGSTRITELTLVPPGKLFAGTERGLYRIDLTAPNATWQSGFTNLPTEEVRAIAVDPSYPRVIFAGFASNRIYRSDDGGAVWNAVGQGAFPTRVRLQTIALNPGASGVVYVGTDSGLYRSADNGVSWTAANEGLPPNANVQAIVVDSASPEDIYAGTSSNGVLHGADHLNALPVPGGLLLGGTVALIALVLGCAAGFVVWRARTSADALDRAWSSEWTRWKPAIAQALQLGGEANEETLAKLPRRHLARALQRYASEYPEQALSLQATPAALRLDTFPLMTKFTGLWKAAWEVVGSEDAFRSVTSQITDHLCGLLGFTRVDERAYKGVMGYVVRAPSLRLKIPPRFPIIFLPRHSIEEGDLDALRDLMSVLNMVSYFALIIDLRDAPPSEPRQSLRYLVRQAIHDFIVLDGKDIRGLLIARDPARQLVEIILSQVDLTVVSPYVTSGPVPTNMFFGREHELKTIVRTVRDANFAIVGGRKIGKTSVLARVHQLLQETPEYQPYYLDCQATQSHEDFFHAIDTMWKVALPAATPEEFRRMAADLSKQGAPGTLVMLFDEIDALLRYDIENGEPLFRILRALAQELPVRFVFCGEKILTGALHDPERVFFNFCNLIPLTYLAPAEARRMVVDPMQEMGIALEKENLADQIVELAASHPNIVQYICQKLIERINHRHDRQITRADLQAISESAQFAEYFVEVTWGNATALERLITLLMLEKPETTLGEMAETLRARELLVAPKELESAFNGLTLYSILRRDGPKYAFAAHAFPEVLRRSQDVYGLILSYSHEIIARNGTQT